MLLLFLLIFIVTICLLLYADNDYLKITSLEEADN